MKVIDNLSVIRHKSKINKDWKHNNLFQIFRKDEIWLSGYINIMVNNETLDTINLKRLKTLRETIINESYQFKIVKLDDQKESLKVFTANDKLIQEVIRIIIETIYEPCFSKQSFRFSQNFGTHDILKHIELKFRLVDWVIEGVYSTINIKQFYKILSKKIKDVRFLNLIYKLIKYEILLEGKLTWSNFGVLQKSIISSIIMNIYYNQLDKWVQKKMLHNPNIEQSNQKYKKLSFQLNKIIYQLKNLDKRLKNYKILLKKLKTIKNKRAKTVNLYIKPIQIEYIRYDNDWMIGINGNQVLARQLKLEVNLFVSLVLKQTIYPRKIKLLNLWTRKINFLGYQIYFQQDRKIKPYINPVPQTTDRTNFKLQFDIPIDSILKKMAKRGYIKKLVNTYRSVSKVNYIALNDKLIIKNFTQVWVELTNYYSGCTDFINLQFINYLLYLSCAMTLAQKHRSSIKKIITKYKKILVVTNNNFKTHFPLQRKWQNKLNFIDPFNIYIK